MRFTTRKRRAAPTVIIVSLIDVLIVVLIFMMVSTTFKKQAAVKLVLPESKQPQAGASETPTLIVTVPKTGPIYFGAEPVTLEKLQEKLTEEVRKNPQTAMSIKADEGAPFGQIVKVMDAAKSAHLKNIGAYTRNGAKP